MLLRLKEVFAKRRSAVNFVEDFEMNKTDFDAIFELARYSPSVFNTQGVRYLVVADKVKQAKLKELCGGQHKLLSASAVILILADKSFMSEANLEKIYGPSVKLGIINEDDNKTMLNQMNYLRKNLVGPEFEREIYRNVYINTGMLISIISVIGFDTCPVHALNTDDIKAYFNLPEHLDVMFCLPIGKAVDAQRPRGYRHRVEELTIYDGVKD